MEERDRVVGKRIKQARWRAGVSQRGLGAKAKVSAQAVSKYERGLDVPSSDVLIRLARALEVRPEFLTRPDALGAPALAFRSCRKLSKKTQRKAEAQVADLVERYQQAQALLIPDETPSLDLPDKAVRKVREPNDAERLAEDLRSRWKLGTGPLENLVETLEDKGIKLESVDLGDDVDACLFQSDDAGPVIAVSPNSPGDRQRFSVARELGHLVLLPTASLDIEKAANRFAGAFLVPKESAHRELGQKRSRVSLQELAYLKQKYKVSMQSWIYRALDLHILSPPAARRLFSLFRARGWREKEPGTQIPPERPRRLELIVWRLLADDLISRSRAAELLGIRASELPSDKAVSYA